MTADQMAVLADLANSARTLRSVEEKLKKLGASRLSMNVGGVAQLVELHIQRCGYGK